MAIRMAVKGDDVDVMPEALPELQLSSTNPRSFAGATRLQLVRPDVFSSFLSVSLECFLLLLLYLKSNFT